LKTGGGRRAVGQSKRAPTRSRYGPAHPDVHGRSWYNRTLDDIAHDMDARWVGEHPARFLLLELATAD
jgi:hypothetical protein